jgi:hypothetical protein
MGYKHGWKQRPLNQEDKQAPQPALWCSSNSLKDDSIQLRLFQCTLIGGVLKWYIELDSSKYAYFNDLAMVLLNHFQLPVRYDSNTKLLTKFELTKYDHISDHIQEW